MKEEGTPNDDVAHNYYMAGIFPFDQVTISSFNRIFKDLNNHSEEESFSVSDQPYCKATNQAR